MPIPTDCPRCGNPRLTEKKLLYYINLFCQKCGWSEDYSYPNELTEQSTIEHQFAKTANRRF